VLKLLSWWWSVAGIRTVDFVAICGALRNIGHVVDF